MTVTMMNTEIDLKTVNVAIEAMPGKTRSKTVTSLENLVNILPIGFESKNRILERTSFSTIALCMFVVAMITIMNIEKPLKKERKT